MSNIERLVVLLVRATNYDDRGYPRRFRRGVLPSNSLAALNSLTMEALDNIIRDPALPIKYSRIEVFDDSVWSQRVDNPGKLVKKYDDGKTIVVVGLVGVQSNQFARARDLIYEFQKAGAQTVIGGFHVSGSIATLHDGIGANDRTREGVPCPRKMPEEIQDLMDGGTIICAGEGENVWQEILTDIIQEKGRPLYRSGYPDLSSVPLPQYPPKYFEGFSTIMTTFDFSRGCPFGCSFCTVINVQGRRLRSRDPKRIMTSIRQTCERDGGIKIFITDDNFFRNPHHDEILDGLIDLRNRGYRINFMCQVDSTIYRTPEFVEKLSAAGCSQVFVGIESVNPANLELVGKKQNDAEQYATLCDLLHRHGVIVHAAYIIGFDNDTKESIMSDVKTLQRVGFDQTTFFILTPLPGSEDHVRAVVAGKEMDRDFNRFESMHCVTDHQNMTRAELERSLYNCYREFYRSAHMINVLKRTSKENYWGMFLCFLWYRNSMLNEKVHPMMCGFMSVRQRKEMRPGNAKEGLIKFLAKESWIKIKYFGLVLKEFYIFQHTYFESKRQTGDEPSTTKISGIRDWFKKTFTLKPSRKWLNDFWIKYGRQKWSLFWKPQWHWRMIPHAISEAVYTWRFWKIFKSSIKKMRK